MYQDAVCLLLSSHQVIPCVHTGSCKMQAEGAILWQIGLLSRLWLLQGPKLLTWMRHLGHNSRATSHLEVSLWGICMQGHFHCTYVVSDNISSLLSATNVVSFSLHISKQENRRCHFLKFKRMYRTGAKMAETVSSVAPIAGGCKHDFLPSGV